MGSNGIAFLSFLVGIGSFEDCAVDIMLCCFPGTYEIYEISVTLSVDYMRVMSSTSIRSEAL